MTNYANGGRIRKLLYGGSSGVNPRKNLGVSPSFPPLLSRVGSREKYWGGGLAPHHLGGNNEQNYCVQLSSIKQLTYTVITLKIWGPGQDFGGLCPPGPNLEPPLLISLRSPFPSLSSPNPPSSSPPPCPISPSFLSLPFHSLKSRFP